MRRLVVVAAIALVVPANPSGAGPACGVVAGVDDLCPAWSAVYDSGVGASVDMGFANAVSPDGQTVYSVGQTWDGQNEALDWLTVAYDAQTGATRWSRIHDSEDESWDWPAVVNVSPDGATVFVAGTTSNDFYLDGDYGVSAYDAVTGDVRWHAAYDHDQGGVEYVHGMTVSPDGARVYLTGRSGIEYAPDYLTIAIDAASGDSDWARTYAGSEAGLDLGVSVAVGADLAEGATDRHVVYVTGSSRGASMDYATVAYDHDGNEVWIARHDGGEGEDNGLYNALSPDGSTLYVTGDVTVARGAGLGYDYDWRTQALDTATGAVRWSADHSGRTAGLDRPFAMTVSPDGARVFVTGLVVGEHDEDRDISVVAYDAATGHQIWATRTGIPHAGSEWGLSLAASPDGSTLAMGGVRSTGTGYRSDAVAELYDAATGDRIAVSDFYAGPSPLEAAVGRAIAFHPDGERIFLTGYTERHFDGAALQTHNDMITVAYDVR